MSDAELNKIKELWFLALSTEEIAAEIGKSVSYIKKIFKILDLKKENRPQKQKPIKICKRCSSPNNMDRPQTFCILCTNYIAKMQKKYFEVFGDPELVALKKEYNRQYSKEYSLKDPNKKKIAGAEYKKKNREYINKARRVEVLTDDGIRQKRKKNKEYREQNRELISKTRKVARERRRKADPSSKIRDSFSTLFRYSMKLNNIKKSESCFDIVGYSLQDFKLHMKNRFELWMNWSNHGVYNPETWDDNDSSTWTWQIDHIIPIASFDFSDDPYNTIKKCWSLTNLRPYSAKQNNIDGGSGIRHIKKGIK